MILLNIFLKNRKNTETPKSSTRKNPPRYT
nr:MAG TPA: hypothetical protein [Caudoviricetes sp.]